MFQLSGVHFRSCHGFRQEKERGELLMRASCAAKVVFFGCFLGGGLGFRGLGFRSFGFRGGWFGV